MLLKKQFFKKMMLFNLFLLVNTYNNYAQTALKETLLNLKEESVRANRKLDPEKLYLQFDKPYYAIGDTIWFKAYLLNAALSGSGKSGIMYVDLTNDSSNVIKQYRLPVVSGISWGSIDLNERGFAPGTYTLRAYTNWMRNLGSTAFFYKRLYLSGTGENNWLIHSVTAVKGDNVDFRMQLSDMQQVPYALKPLQLLVTSGSKNLYKQKLQTDSNGLISINFKLPEKTSGISLVAKSEDKNAVFPISLNRTNFIDVQFLPEGGSLIAGTTARIGFKTIGEDGLGIDVSGKVTDHYGRQVAEFHSLHKGMGSFDLLTVAGEIYTANVNLPGGTIKSYPLPAVNNSGTSLQVKNEFQTDSVEVAVEASEDVVKAGNSYFLTGIARGVICYAAIINFSNSRIVNWKIAKRLFPTGTTRFTLTGTNRKPLNERIIFIDQRDNLQISYTTNKPVYRARDSIALKIKVTDRQGVPIAGNFSLSVTDDRQVKRNAGEENILSRFLLTSDLKGYVEEPGWYYPVKNDTVWQSLDNLLLTQGWVHYEQETNAVTTFKAEQDFTVSGRIDNLLGKPLKKTKVSLLSKSPQLFKDTVTDDKGRFLFNRFPRADTPLFFIQAVNRSGRSFNVDVKVDEVKPPVFSKPPLPLVMPWYVNTDTTLLNYVKTNTRAKELEYVSQGSHLLKEVKITAKRIVTGSQNLNGPGNADLVIDEKELEKAGRKAFLDLLRERVPGFKEGSFLLSGDPSINRKVYRDRNMAGFIVDNSISTIINQEWYFINDKPVKFIIDGTPLYKVLTMSLPAITNINDFLNSHSAEGIKGIEVNTSSKYCMKYIPAEWAPLISPSDIAFVEITTRSGNGPVIRNTPGTYLYKPLPVSFPKQFYKPRYNVSEKSRPMADFRSTIDWEPSFNTNEMGEAVVSFYSADNAVTNSIVIEGGDLNGYIGFLSGKISFKRE